MDGLHEHCDSLCSNSSVCPCSPPDIHNDVPDRNSPSPRLKIRCHLLQETHPSHKNKLNQLVAHHHGNHLLPLHHHQCRYSFLYSGYLIYTRKVFTTHQAKLFFMLVIVSFAIKYFMLAQYNSGTDIMAKRNEIKTTDILKNRRRDQF